MTIDDDLLMAFADGELDEVTRARVERAVAEDPALKARLEVQQRLRARLAAHYGPAVDEAVPERLRAMLGERNVTLVLDDSARSLLAREGYDPNYGARPLKRAIQTLIQNPLATKLLGGQVSAGQIVHVSADDDGMKFTLEREATEAAASEATG